MKGRVVEVVSGDTIFVVAPGKNYEKRLTFSSVRAPWMGNRSKNEPAEPYGLQARERLRTLCIGRTVFFHIESTRPNDTGERAMAHVVLEKSRKNLCEMMVAEGLLKVLNHRPDEPKSSIYEELLISQAQAMQKQLGLHSGKQPSQQAKNNDLTADASKARQYLTFLQKENNRAVVDVVYSGARLKLIVLQQNCIVNFSLAGIRCPQAGRTGGKDSKGRAIQARSGEPMANEAKVFTRQSVNQMTASVN